MFQRYVMHSGLQASCQHCSLHGKRLFLRGPLECRHSGRPPAMSQTFQHETQLQHAFALLRTIGPPFDTI
jgi:hypothetical protein